MRRRPFAVILLGALSVAATGCSSSSTPERATPTTHERATPTTLDGAAPRPKGTLEFRAVQYSGAVPLIIPTTTKTTGPGGRSCAALVKASAQRPASPS